MERFLNRYSPDVYALLRIIAGLMFALHGMQKLFGWPGGKPPVPIASLMGLAGLIEVIGGLMIAFGFLAGSAAFIASGEMTFAYFIAHAPHGFFPILNQGEVPVLYAFLFLYIATQGSGIWSADALIRPRSANHRPPNIRPLRSQRSA
ncbi:MAG: DoxX family protein [Nitrospirae bacterium]|nr:DoxX family protein [Candidatus Manganitrophaceae bacterium]